MLKKNLYILITLIFYSVIISAQKYTINGNVADNQTKTGLAYSNIKVEGTGFGTSTNISGEFKLNLAKGNYLIIASYLGYKSDSVKVELNSDKIINFSLESVQLKLDEVTVRPGRNPAYDIIEKAIAAKEKIKSKISDYSYSAYTKGLIKTTQDFQNSSYSISSKDTGEIKITGIIENESRGFFKTPDLSKYYIVARKQSANTPPFVNVLTGGNILQSFYEDKLAFLGKMIPSPISKQALTYYYFYIEKETAIDNKKVYQIYFAPDNTADPGFYGNIFIEDETYNLLKVDVNLNRMANPGGLFDNIKVFQQFSLFDNGIVLPVDYRIFAYGNYIGIVKFGFELNTIMNNYEINKNIEDDFFDNTLISVLPEADKKTEEYWNSIQSIPNTTEETLAYARIDSLKKAKTALGEEINFLSERIKLNDYFSISGPLALYSFNKVEGSTLNFDLYFSDSEEQRLNGNLDFSYGFSEKKFKKQISALYKFGDYRTTSLRISAYDKITDLFGVSDNYNKFTSTFLSLLTKYDFRDYYYSKGFETEISSDIFPILNVGIGFKNRTDKSAINNSDFSFFYPSKKYNENKNIYNTKTNSISANFSIDFRKFIEDGFFRRRIPRRTYIILEGSAEFSDIDFLKSQNNFSLYELNAFGSFPTSDNWMMEFYADKIFPNGAVPFQLLHALPGNISAAGKNNSFRTLRIGEVFGDDITEVFLNHNFGDELFSLLQIPFIQDLQLQFAIHLNAAVSNISSDSKNILMHNSAIFKKPFYELGFSVGHLLIPLSFEFTWKLNYLGKNNFVFGINTFAL
ncbi:MAG: carboxypeptidase-like regulatory domain-containing protein [Ignavibacteriales bacterium]|nr:carboxypeptidase-like regulatory domain-containing protein [Ignavibacteriales bacterium]